MVNSEIIRIPVDTQEFDAYLESVKEYRKQLEAISKIVPSTVLKKNKNNTKEFLKNNENEKSSKKDAKFVDNIKKVKEKIISLNEKDNKYTRKRIQLLSEQLRILYQTGHAQSRLVDQARSFASSPIGKIGLAAVTVGGIIYAGKRALDAGLKIATAGTSIRSESRNFGVNAGQLQSWRTNFAPYGDANTILGIANKTQVDPELAAKLAGLGVDRSALKSGNTSEVGVGIVKALPRVVKQYGVNSGQVLEAYGLGGLTSEAQSLARVSPTELNELIKQLRSDSGKLNINDDVLKKDQEASVNAGRLRATWTTTKIKETAPLVSGMATAAEKASESLDDLAINASKAAAAIIDGYNKNNSNGLNDKSEVSLTSLASSYGKTLHNTVDAFHKEGGWSHPFRSLWSAGKTYASGVIKEEKDASFAAFPSFKKWAYTKVDSNGRPISSQNDDTSLSAGSYAPPSVVRRNNKLGATDEELKTAHDSILRNEHFKSLYTAHPKKEDIDYLIGAVAMQESHGNPNAVSSAGAKGLLQFMDPTAKQYGLKNPFDPKQSWQAAEKYFGNLLSKYHDVEKSLAAYNYGPGNVDKQIKLYGNNWRDGLKDETRGYEKRIARFAEKGTIVRIENYTGQSLTQTTRQASLL